MSFSIDALNMVIHHFLLMAVVRAISLEQYICNSACVYFSFLLTLWWVLHHNYMFHSVSK